MRYFKETPEQAAEIWRIHQRFMPKTMRNQPSVEHWIASPTFAPTMKAAVAYAEAIKFRAEKLRPASTPEERQRPIVDESSWVRVGNMLSELAGRVFRPAAATQLLRQADRER